MFSQLKTFLTNYFADDELVLAPHPGVYYGQYPSKKQEDNSVLENIVKRGKKIAADVLNPQNTSQQKMLETVHDTHETLISMSDAELDEWIVDVKYQLHAGGLTDELICLAFATIKEVANRELSMSHYDSQLLGGWIMMQGMNC